MRTKKTGNMNIYKINHNKGMTRKLIWAIVNLE